jgi:hypothetical protein
VASQLGVGDEIIRIKFLKGMPDDIRSTLVAYDGGTLEELARVADTLLAYKPSLLPVHNITSQKLGPVDQYRFNDTPATPQSSYHQEDTHAYINYVPTQTNKQTNKQTKTSTTRLQWTSTTENGELRVAQQSAGTTTLL